MTEAMKGSEERRIQRHRCGDDDGDSRALQDVLRSAPDVIWRSWVGPGMAGKGCVVPEFEDVDLEADLDEGEDEDERCEGDVDDSMGFERHDFNYLGSVESFDD